MQVFHFRSVRQSAGREIECVCVRVCVFVCVCACVHRAGRMHQTLASTLSGLLKISRLERGREREQERETDRRRKRKREREREREIERKRANAAGTPHHSST